MGFHGVCIYEVPLSYSYWDFDRVYQHLTGGIYIYIYIDAILNCRAPRRIGQFDLLQNVQA